MIGRSRDREVIVALQDTVHEQSLQLTVLRSEIATMAERQLLDAKRCAACDTAIEDLLNQASEAETLLTAQAALIQACRDQITALTLEAAQLAEAVKECRGGLARLDLQMESNMAEVRETSTALAGVVFGRVPAGNAVVSD